MFAENVEIYTRFHVLEKKSIELSNDISERWVSEMNELASEQSERASLDIVE